MEESNCAKDRKRSLFIHSGPCMHETLVYVSLCQVLASSLLNGSLMEQEYLFITDSPEAGDIYGELNRLGKPLLYPPARRAPPLWQVRRCSAAATTVQHKFMTTDRDSRGYLGLTDILTALRHVCMGPFGQRVDRFHSIQGVFGLRANRKGVTLFQFKEWSHFIICLENRT